MSASTDQKVRELVARLERECITQVKEPGYELHYDKAATLITQAIAVETAVLREVLTTIWLCTLEKDTAEFAEKALGHLAKNSASPIPGAKAEDTASAECPFCAGAGMLPGQKVCVCSGGDRPEDADMRRLYKDAKSVAAQVLGEANCSNEFGLQPPLQEQIENGAYHILAFAREHATYLRTKEQP